MQFRMSHLLAVITALCILLGIVFISPPYVGTPAILLFLELWAPIWIIGVVYARGSRQAFFLGGVIGGAFPWWWAHYHFLFTLNAYVNGIVGGNYYRQLWSPAYSDEWWWSNLILALPWLMSFLGGIAAIATYRLAAANKV